MAIYREEIHKMIEKLPEEELSDIYTFIKDKSEKNSKVEEAFNNVIKNYDETLKGLVKR